MSGPNVGGQRFQGKAVLLLFLVQGLSCGATTVFFREQAEGSHRNCRLKQPSW